MKSNLNFALTTLYLVSLLHLTSCTYRSYFGDGYHALENQYLDKPHYDSIPEIGWYVSANATLASGYNLNFDSAKQGDLNQVYEVLVHRAKTYRNIGWAYGLFGYYGDYQFGDQHEKVLANEYLTHKSYYGVGGKLHVVWNLPYGRVNFRPLGLDVTINREFGQYSDFIRQLEGKYAQVNVVDDPLGVNFGITSSFRYETQKNLVIGYQVRLAIPDRTYKIVYGTNPNGKQPLIGGVHSVAFIGIRRLLLQTELGMSSAQFYIGSGFTYRLLTERMGNRKRSSRIN